MTLDKQYFRDKYPSDYGVPLPEVHVAIKLLLEEIERLEGLLDTAVENLDACIKMLESMK